MASMFNERKALQLTLQSLLEQRMVLRRQYVDQDRELGSEIKQILNRIREMDFQEGIEGSHFDEEVATTAEALPEELTKRIKVRKAHVRYDYLEIARYMESLLREETKPLSLADLCELLKKRHGVEFASPYIGIQKALKHVPHVKVEKDGRKLMFSLKS